jgi:hypothetical protein
VTAVDALNPRSEYPINFSGKFEPFGTHIIRAGITIAVSRVEEFAIERPVLADTVEKLAQPSPHRSLLKWFCGHSPKCPKWRNSIFIGAAVQNYIPGVIPETRTRAHFAGFFNNIGAFLPSAGKVSAEPVFQCIQIMPSIGCWTIGSRGLYGTGSASAGRTLQASLPLPYPVPVRPRHRLSLQPGRRRSRERQASYRTDVRPCRAMAVSRSHLPLLLTGNKTSSDDLNG